MFALWPSSRLFQISFNFFNFVSNLSFSTIYRLISYSNHSNLHRDMRGLSCWNLQLTFDTRDHGNVFALTLLDLLTAFDTRGYTILYQLLEHVWHTEHYSPMVPFLSLKHNSYCSCQRLYLCPSAHLLWNPTWSAVGPFLFVLNTATLSDVIDSHSLLISILLLCWRLFAEIRGLNYESGLR